MPECLFRQGVLLSPGIQAQLQYVGVMLALYRHICVLEIERKRLPLVLQEGSSTILVMPPLLPGAANRGTTATLASIPARRKVAW